MDGSEALEKRQTALNGPKSTLLRELDVHVHLNRKGNMYRTQLEPMALSWKVLLI